MKSGIRNAIVKRPAWLSALVSAILARPARFAAGEAAIALDHFPTEKLTEHGGAAERREAVRQLLPELSRCGADALQPAQRHRPDRRPDPQEPAVHRRKGRRTDEGGDPPGRRKGVVRRAAARPVGDRAFARVRSAGSGADWLYTYLRSYYRDADPPHGLEQRGVRERRHAARVLGPAGRSRRDDRGDQGGQGRADRQGRPACQEDRRHLRRQRCAQREVREARRPEAPRVAALDTFGAGWRQDVEGAVRRDRRRPGRLRHLHVRPERADPHPAGRLGAAVPRPAHGL